MVWAWMLWYYVSDRQERLAVPEDQLAALAGSGVLRPTTLVWRKGMEEWTSAGELKPEWFSGGDGLPSTVAEGEDRGLVTELAQTLRPYAAWVSLSGWMHGLTAVLLVAGSIALGYFAWRRPERLLEWSPQLPDGLRPLLAGPWWTVGAALVLALLLFFMGAQLIGGAARIRRAGSLQSREELRIALRSVGSFFRATVLTLFLALIAGGALLLHHYRPWQKAKPEAPVPAAAPKERVTI